CPNENERRGYRRLIVQGLFWPSEILVNGILDRALYVSDAFLNLALRILRCTLSLKLGVACRFSDAFLDLPRGLVGQAGNFVAGATHLLYNPEDARRTPLLNTQL